VGTSPRTLLRGRPGADPHTTTRSGHRAHRVLLEIELRSTYFGIGLITKPVLRSDASQQTVRRKIHTASKNLVPTALQLGVLFVPLGALELLPRDEPVLGRQTSG
jgi:hypothetical protein